MRAVSLQSWVGWRRRGEEGGGVQCCHVSAPRCPEITCQSKRVWAGPWTRPSCFMLGDGDNPSLSERTDLYNISASLMSTFASRAGSFGAVCEVISDCSHIKSTLAAKTKIKARDVPKNKPMKTQKINFCNHLFLWDWICTCTRVDWTLFLYEYIHFLTLCVLFPTSLLMCIIL